MGFGKHHLNITRPLSKLKRYFLSETLSQKNNWPSQDFTVIMFFSIIPLLHVIVLPGETILQ